MSIFGKPNQGIHSYRFCNIAIVDAGMTIILAFILSYYMHWPWYWTLIGLFLLGILLHRVFNVRTTIDRLLF